MNEITGRVDASTAKLLDDDEENETVIVHDPAADEYLVTRPKSKGGDES